MVNIRRVKIADFAVLKKEGLLITIGLGSCVGIAMFDPVAMVAGLAHILLADSTQFAKRDNLAKFADTAVPLTLGQMTSLGARQERIKAKIAGGSELFSFKQNGESVGKRNVAAVIRALEAASIPLVAADVGGNNGRTMKIIVNSCKVFVAKSGQEEQEL